MFVSDGNSCRKRPPAKPATRAPRCKSRSITFWQDRSATDLSNLLEELARPDRVLGVLLYDRSGALLEASRPVARYADFFRAMALGVYTQSHPIEGTFDLPGHRTRDGTRAGGRKQEEGCEPVWNRPPHAALLARRVGRRGFQGRRRTGPRRRRSTMKPDQSWGSSNDGHGERPGADFC